MAAGNSVRQALQELLSEYMENQGKKPSEHLDEAIHTMLNRTRVLRKQLRKAVVDHVSDGFLEPDNPLLMLIAAAKEGREKEVEEFAGMFTNHAHKLVEVANLACSMSNNDDGVKMVRYASSQIENLCPQVVNAARILGARHNSKVIFKLACHVICKTFDKLTISRKKSVVVSLAMTHCKKFSLYSLIMKMQFYIVLPAIAKNYVKR